MDLAIAASPGVSTVNDGEATSTLFAPEAIILDIRADGLMSRPSGDFCIIPSHLRLYQRQRIFVMLQQFYHVQAHHVTSRSYSITVGARTDT